MKSRFDPYVWSEAKTNVENESPKGRLWLRLSAPSALYVAAQGYEALAGYASEFDLEISEAVTFRIEAAKGVRAFRFDPVATSLVADEASFTNIDRMPHESGMLAEVTRARRQLEIERRAFMADIRREAAIAKNAARGVDGQKVQKPNDKEGITVGDANVLPEGEAKEGEQK